MRSRRSLSVSLVALALAAPFGAGAAAPSRTSAATPAGTELTLSVTGRASNPPDLTVARLSVRQEASTAAAAQAAVNRVMAASLAAAAAMAGVRATTGGYSVFPGDAKPTTWQAQQTLTLRLAAPPGSAQAASLRRLIGTLQSKGVLLEDISGTLSRAAARRTRAQAIADAVGQMRSEAGDAAAALGVKVEAVTRMTLGTQTPFLPRPMMLAARMATAAAPQAQPGPIAETVSLTATVRLGPS